MTTDLDSTTISIGFAEPAFGVDATLDPSSSTAARARPALPQQPIMPASSTNSTPGVSRTAILSDTVLRTPAPGNTPEVPASANSSGTKLRRVTSISCCPYVWHMVGRCHATDHRFSGITASSDATGAIGLAMPEYFWQTYPTPHLSILVSLSSLLAPHVAA